MYRYAQNRADRLEGITELVLDQLRRTAHDFRALAHPHVVPLLVTRPLSAPLGPAALSSRPGGDFPEGLTGP